MESLEGGPSEGGLPGLRDRLAHGLALQAPPRPAALAALTVMAGAQIAYPLAPAGRALLSTITVVAIAAATLLLLAEAWGTRRAAVTAAAVVLGMLAVEAVGVRGDYPFGAYRYGSALRPMVLGVPAIVPLAWFGLGIPAYAVAARLVARPWLRVVVGALALTAWDLFLDPQMLREGFWVWLDGGAYRDVPISNLTGWLAVSVFLMLLLDALPRPGARLDWLVALYIWTWAMETVGFLVFFRDALVALTGGVAMGVFALAALFMPARAQTDDA